MSAKLIIVFRLIDHKNLINKLIGFKRIKTMINFNDILNLWDPFCLGGYVVGTTR